MTCAPNEGSGLPSLVKVWRRFGFLASHKVHSEDWSDWRKPRLIRVFAGHTRHFVGLVLLQLNFHILLFMFQLFAKLQATKQEIQDLQEEHVKERQELEQTQNELTRELKLKYVDVSPESLKL